MGLIIPKDNDVDGLSYFDGVKIIVLMECKISVL